MGSSRTNESYFILQYRRICLQISHQRFRKRTIISFLVILFSFLCVCITTTSNTRILRRWTKTNDSNSSKVSQDERRKFLREGIENLRVLNYPKHPRTVGYYFHPHNHDTTSTTSRSGESLLIGYQDLPDYIVRKPIQKHISISSDFRVRQERLNDEIFYSDNSADPMEEGDCVLQHDWQGTSYPTCNILHEIALNDFGSSTDPPTARAPFHHIIEHESYRDVWETQIKSDPRNKLKHEYIILKTLQIDTEFSERNLDRHRRDALALERLTRSQFISDIYGYCAMSRLSESYGSDGDELNNDLFTQFYSNDANYTLPSNMKERLDVALNIARIVAEIHNSEETETPVIVHTDIRYDMVKKIADGYKMDDFTRCRFLNHNKNSKATCPFLIDHNGGVYRSPEEYNYAPENEKIDLYSMGNILYLILTGMDIYEYSDEAVSSSEEVKSLIQKGVRSDIPDELRNSTDIRVMAMVKVIDLCWIHTPDQRPSAREIERILSEAASKI